MDTVTEIDALGLLCPLPVLRLRKRISGLSPGSIVRVLADDPAAAIDIPHFCAEAGHEFLDQTPLNGAEPQDGKAPRAFTIRLG
ncbi:MAG: sulfurtransferase TusA family protein [Paracoccaceae bacterium]